MTLTFRTDGAWGTGKGAPLTAAEVDGNFHGLDSRVTALETNPPSAVGIQSFQVVGTQLYVHMQDGDTFGPYVLPQTAYQPPTVRNESGSTLTLALTDANFYICTTNATACAVTIPTNATVALPLYTEVVFRQSAAGAISFTAASGVTLRKRADKSAATNADGAVVRLKKVATDTWDLFGDLA